MLSVLSIFQGFAKDLSKTLVYNKSPLRWFSSNFGYQTTSSISSLLPLNIGSRSLLQPDNSDLSLTRNVTKFSLKTGKKKSVYPVLTRFYRLHNGLWIRRRAGCHKRLHKRNAETKYSLTQHVVCTKAQCIMLDKMITDHHKKRKYYIDDPFEPYHDRHGIHWVPPVKKR